MWRQLREQWHRFGSGGNGDSGSNGCRGSDGGEECKAVSAANLIVVPTIFVYNSQLSKFTVIGCVLVAVGCVLLQLVACRSLWQHR